MLDSDVVTHTLPRTMLILLLGLTLQAALAQRCTDYVAVDGKLLDAAEGGAVACYFGDGEGAKNAYVRTDIVTAALGLESDYLPDTGRLLFEKGGVRVEVAATDDVAAALAPRPEAMTVGGAARRGRSAVLAGSSFLPLAELVGAFGGATSWNPKASLVVVDFSAPAPEAATAAVPPAEPATESASVPPSGPLRQLGAPRYAAHEDGYTRVAVDVPAGLEYTLAVDEGNFIVLFGGARAEPYEVTPDGEQLASLGYREVGSSGVLALIAGATYPLGANGRGFEVGRLPAAGGGETLYIDFAPNLRGERVARVKALPGRELAAAQRPADVQKVVVIDPGHGGHDPGAVGEYVVEKDLVLGVGLLLRDELERRGIRVELTRDDDTFMELEDRAAFAVPSEHNLFVSLHANAAEASAEGIETWVFGQPQDDSLIDLAVLENGGGDVGRARTAASIENAASIDGDLLREENLSYSTALADTVQEDLVEVTGSRNRGVKQNYFVVIRDARVPAVLVELGFVDSPLEGPKLATESYRHTLATALADGIEAFLAQGGTLASSGRDGPDAP